MKELIRANRRKLEKDLSNSRQRWLFSPASYSHYKVTLPMLRQYARGRLIDVGCGDMPFRAFLLKQVDAYDSLDLYPRAPDVTFVGDVQNMSFCADNSFDTVICLEVLEHVRDAFKAVQEMHRILRADGMLILSVPHISRLHDEPNDYYRFTQYGLLHILESAGFQVLSLQKRGGLFSFLGHQLSTVCLGVVWNVPLLKDMVWFLNSWLVTRLSYALDSVVDGSGTFAMGYSVAAKKRRRIGTAAGSSEGIK